MKKKLFCIALYVLLITALISGCTPKPTENAPAENPPADNKPAVESVAKDKVFVTAEWVKSVIDGNQPESADFKIIEAAWGSVEEDKEYLDGHVPGAVHMNTDDIEESTYWNIKTGEEIEQVMADYGITKDIAVIVYGPDSGANRVAFVCLWAGVENVKVLDGGIGAWKRAGYDTEKEVVAAVPTTKEFGATIPTHPEYVLSMPQDVLEAQKNANFHLVSIRSQEEFEGKTSGYSYIKKAGEPEGAVWGHDEADYRNGDGTVVEFSRAVALWNEQGITEVHDIAFYCGTGWRATVPWLLAYENGWDNIQLYDGGWFVWQMDAANPVQTITPEEAAARFK